MILKQDAEKYIGKKVKFLVNGMHTPHAKDCIKGIVKSIEPSGRMVAHIERGGIVFWSDLEDIFPADADIPDVVSEQEEENIKEDIVRQYMATMDTMEALLRFPLLYSMDKELPREAYVRRMKEVLERGEENV